MRLLVLDFNLSYINPTRNLLAGVLKEVAQTDFFGPGFVSREKLLRGLSAYLDDNGPYDLVLATEHILFNWIWDKESQRRAYRTNYVKPFEDELLFCSEALYQDFLKIPAARRGALLLESDYYNFSSLQSEILEAVEGVFIGFGEQFLRPVAELPHLSGETFASSANNNWQKFVAANQKRMVSLPMFLSAEEFCFIPLALRKKAWSIMGASYVARREALKHLESAGITVEGRTLSRMLSILDRVHLRPLARPVVQNMFRHCFQLGLESTRYSYTCGSGLGFPVRKFFEIPASGAVLVCRPCNGFAELGFVDGENALICEPSDVLAAHDRLERDKDWAQSLATRGRELVWCHHTVFARARQLSMVLEATQAGQFGGTYWENGEFHVIRL